MIDDVNPSVSQAGSAHPGDEPHRLVAAQVTEGVTQVTEIDRLEAELESLDAALERIQSGTYGACNVCGAVIDDALLEADPSLATCPAHVRLS